MNNQDRPWEYKPLNMQLWKFLLWALALALICCIAIGLWTGVLTLFFAKPQEVELMTPDHQGHSNVVRDIDSTKARLGE